MSYWQTRKRHLAKTEKLKLQYELREFFETLRFLLHVNVVGKIVEQKLFDIDSFFNEISLIIESFRKTEKLSPAELACLLS